MPHGAANLRRRRLLTADQASDVKSLHGQCFAVITGRPFAGAAASWRLPNPPRASQPASELPCQASRKRIAIRHTDCPAYSSRPIFFKITFVITSPLKRDFHLYFRSCVFFDIWFLTCEKSMLEGSPCLIISTSPDGDYQRVPWFRARHLGFGYFFLAYFETLWIAPFSLRPEEIFFERNLLTG